VLPTASIGFTAAAAVVAVAAVVTIATPLLSLVLPIPTHVLHYEDDVLAVIAGQQLPALLCNSLLTG
jgi:hypothetical protein